MFGLHICKHFKELGGKVKDGVDKGQYQWGMLLFLGWDGGLWMDGREQKVGWRGCEGEQACHRKWRIVDMQAKGAA